MSKIAYIESHMAAQKKYRWIWALPILARLIVVCAFWVIDRWQDSPQRFFTGEEIALTNDPVWTFTDKEIAACYAENKDGVTD